jgi:hypothetical protein
MPLLPAQLLSLPVGVLQPPACCLLQHAGMLLRPARFQPLPVDRLPLARFLLLSASAGMLPLHARLLLLLLARACCRCDGGAGCRCLHRPPAYLCRPRRSWMLPMAAAAWGLADAEYTYLRAAPSWRRERNSARMAAASRALETEDYAYLSTAPCRRREMISDRMTAAARALSDGDYISDPACAYVPKIHTHITRI